MNIWNHFATITKHRWLVRKYCFKLGLYWQGLVHDLSKYSPVEFKQGCHYFMGYRSPNDGERRDCGYSKAWMHHKGRNKHHSEYWTDFPTEPTGEKYICVEMPDKYLEEMFCDRVAASKTYLGKDYTDASAYEYFERTKEHLQIHPTTEKKLEYMLRYLKDNGEKKTFPHIRHMLERDLCW